VVSCRFVNAEEQFRFQTGPYGVYGRQSGNGAGFFPSASVFFRQNNFTEIFHISLTLIFLKEFGRLEIKKIFF